MHWLSRTELLLGKENIEILSGLRIAVLGLGGVGSAAVEAIARAGVGHLLLVDHDTIDETNLNRQLIATRDNLGEDKCEAVKKRILSINPEVEVIAEKRFYLPDNSEFLFDFQPDYIIDAIDTVTAKLHLAENCRQRSIKLISCLGTGNRLDPTQLAIGDIADTAGYGCPLARLMRKELRKREVDKLTVLYSKELPAKALIAENSPEGRHSPASTAFVPPVAGYFIASYAIRELLGLLS